MKRPCIQFLVVATLPFGGCSGQAEDLVFAGQQGVPKGTQADIDLNGESRNERLLYADGMDLGSGISMRTGEILSGSDCLAPFSMVRSAILNQTQKRAILLRGKADLATALGIGGGFSFVVGPMTVSLSARFEGAMSKNANHVFLLVMAERQIAEYRVDRAALREPELRRLYESGRGAFRRRCGDHFVNSIVTGGRFWGLIEIETSNSYDKLAVEAKLSGRFNPLGISVGGGFKIALAELASRYRMRIHVISQGTSFPYTFEVDPESLSQYPTGENVDQQEQEYLDELVNTDLQKFLDEFADFYRATEGLEVGVDYRRNALLATIESYDSIAPATAATSSDMIVRRIAVAERKERYEELLRQVEQTLQSVGLLVDRTETNTETTADELEILATQARHAIRTLTVVARRCSRALDASCPSIAELEALPITSPQSIEDLLPQDRQVFPATCEELQSLFHVWDDGNYTLFLGRDRNKPFDVYCANMAEGDGSNRPQAYLVVGAEGLVGQFDSTPQSSNFGIHVRPRQGEGEDGEDVDSEDPNLGEDEERIHVYERVPVHIAHDFVSVAAPGDLQDGRLGPYGSASTCQRRVFRRNNNNGTASDPANRVANIDLHRTPFILAPSVSWTTGTSLYLENQAQGFDDAATAAKSIQGSLAVIASTEDHHRLVAALNDSVHDAPVWIGLHCPIGHDRFQWENGFAHDYTHWLDYPQAPCTERVCVALAPTGEFVTGDCKEKRGYFIEYNRTDAAVVVSTDRKQADLYLSSLDGSCVYIQPVDDVILHYHGEEDTP